MAEYNIPTNEQEFEQNFSQIKPLMNKTEAYYESSRCLFCYDAPCVEACPTHIDIPLFIRQINTNNITGAARTIYDSNYFGNACGKVCPTEVLCEGACVYNHQDVKPIEIGRLQNFATSQAIANDIKYYTPGKANGKKAAIIGSGPAGIACACELRKAGVHVDIYEAKSNPTGLTVNGIAPYKITNDEVLAELAYLQTQFGFNIIYNSPIMSKDDVDKLEKNYDAIFIGVGNGATSSLGIPGEDKANVHGAVEIIEHLRRDSYKVAFGKKVIVLGGGNTAMDAASESARMGCPDVTLAYRRSKEEMGAYHFEYALAKDVGVKGMFNAAPLEIIGNGKVTAVKFIKTKTENGKVVNIPGSEFVLECDMVIMATGQKGHDYLFDNISSLEVNGTKVKANNYQTTNPKYFVGGDCLNGGAEVVNAAYDGKHAGKAMMSFMGVNL